MNDINKDQLLRHIAKSDLTALEKRYLEKLVAADGSYKDCNKISDGSKASLTVKRGRWELCIERFMTNIYACSVCRSKFGIQSNLVPESFYCYCPRCGADMRGETDVLH